MKINRFFNLSKFFYAFSELSQWIQLVVSLPPFFYPKFAQTLCEGACSLCVALSLSPGEDEPGEMCLLSSGQTSQFLTEQSKM